jgi:guanylate kinase
MSLGSTPHKIIIITAPSGSGKTTIVHYLMQQFPQLAFSVSACTRPPRPNEQHGVNYYFISVEEFQEKIKEDAFVEYEMVYEGKYYGTLKSEVERIWNQQQFPLVDIDVQGALRIQEQAQYETISIFIQPPSVEELERRLKSRGTETEQSLKERLDKSVYEMSFANQFDHVVVNNVLAQACKEVQDLITTFVS